MRKAIRLAAFDMDGTLVDTVSSWAFVHHHFGENNDEGLRAFMRDEIDDEEFVRRDLGLWKRHMAGITDADLARILREVPIMPGARELMRALRGQGVRTAIISGGLEHLADRVKNDLEMDAAFANGFYTDAQGVLVRGRISVPVKRKEEVLRGLQNRLGIPPEETASVGNSEIDVGLFRASTVKVAFLPQDDYIIRHATDVVREKDMRQIIPLILGEES